MGPYQGVLENAAMNSSRNPHLSSPELYDKNGTCGGLTGHVPHCETAFALKYRAFMSRHAILENQTSSTILNSIQDRNNVFEKKLTVWLKHEWYLRRGSELPSSAKIQSTMPNKSRNSGIISTAALSNAITFNLTHAFTIKAQPGAQSRQICQKKRRTKPFSWQLFKERNNRQLVIIPIEQQNSYCMNT